MVSSLYSLRISLLVGFKYIGELSKVGTCGHMWRMRHTGSGEG